MPIQVISKALIRRSLMVMMKMRRRIF